MTFKKAVILGFGFAVGTQIFNMVLDLEGWVSELSFKTHAKLCEESGVSPILEMERLLKNYPMSSETKKEIRRMYKNSIKK